MCSAQCRCRQVMPFPLSHRWLWHDFPTLSGSPKPHLQKIKAHNTGGGNRFRQGKAGGNGMGATRCRARRPFLLHSLLPSLSISHRGRKISRTSPVSFSLFLSSATVFPKNLLRLSLSLSLSLSLRRLKNGKGKFFIASPAAAGRRTTD